MFVSTSEMDASPEIPSPFHVISLPNQDQRGQSPRPAMALLQGKQAGLLYSSTRDFTKPELLEKAGRRMFEKKCQHLISHVLSSHSAALNHSQVPRGLKRDGQPWGLEPPKTRSRGSLTSDPVSSSTVILNIKN